MKLVEVEFPYFIMHHENPPLCLMEALCSLINQEVTGLGSERQGESSEYRLSVCGLIKR